MKWILVVLIGGVTPVTTDLTFQKLSDCLAAEVQLGQTYAEAFDAWSQRDQPSPERYGRRRERDYYRVRELEIKKFANTGTCVPHMGSDQPVTSLNQPDQPPSPSQAAPVPRP